MKLRITYAHAFLAALCIASCLAACGGADDNADDLLDAAVHGGVPATKRLATLQASKQAWQELVAKNGARYWFDEQNCPINSTVGTGTLVQIDHGEVQNSQSHLLTRSQCEEAVSRRGSDFKPASIDALYGQCHDLLKRAGFPHPAIEDVVFTLDAMGVIETCKATEIGCSDVCDDGFHLAHRAFGDRPDPGQAACEINGIVYASGSDGVPDTHSCNTCTCVNGELTACTEIDCFSEECPKHNALNVTCSKCSPDGFCEVVRLGCQPTCQTDDDCEEPRTCMFWSACGNSCG